MINLCNTLLPNDRVKAIPADIGKIIKPIPVIDRVIEVDVAPMIMIESTDSNTVFRVLKILYLFLDLFFMSLKYVVISLMFLTWLLKLLTSFIFLLIFVQCHYFLMVHLGIIYPFSGPFIISKLKQIYQGTSFA